MSWDSVKVSDFLKERQGRFKPDNSEITSLRRIEKIDFSGKIYLSDKSSRTDMILVKKGDLVISGINVCKGALAVYEGNEDVIATIHYSSYEHNKEKIDIDFLKRFLKSKSFLNLIKEQVPGGIKTEIKQKHLLPLKVSLPDLAEQRIIASKFQQTERKYNVLTTEITNQKTLLSKLKQSILQEAIQGKLTADWRKQNPELITGENSAEKLLERIKAEKEKLVKEGKIKREKSLPLITEYKIPYNLPDSWFWTYLQNFIINKDELKVPLSKTIRNIRRGNYNYYGASGVIDKIDDYLYDGTYLLIGEDRENLRSKSTSVAFIVSGKFWVNNHAHVLEGLFNNNLEYLKIFLNFLDLEPYLTRGFQPKLSQENLRKILVPISPHTEQEAIVSKVGALMKKCNELEQYITQNKKDSELLIQTVLKEAFEGKM